MPNRNPFLFLSKDEAEIDASGNIKLKGAGNIQEEAKKANSSTPQKQIDPKTEDSQAVGPEEESATAILEDQSDIGVATSDEVRMKEEIIEDDENKKRIEEDKEIEELTRKVTKKQLEDQLKPEFEEPDLLNRVNEYKMLREEQGIADLESELQTIKERKLELNREYKQFKGKEPTGVSLGFATGRISEKGEEIQKQLDELNDRERLLTDQITAKTTYINNILDLKEADYNDELEKYNTQYNRNLKIQNTLDSNADERQKSARTFLSTVTNLMKDSGIKFSEIDTDLKNQIREKEMQAGYPEGTIEEFSISNPNARLMATTKGVNDAGDQVVAFTYMDENGMPYTKYATLDIAEDVKGDVIFPTQLKQLWDKAAEENNRVDSFINDAINNGFDTNMIGAYLDENTSLNTSRINDMILNASAEPITEEGEKKFVYDTLNMYKDFDKKTAIKMAKEDLMRPISQGGLGVDKLPSFYKKALDDAKFLIFDPEDERKGLFKTREKLMEEFGLTETNQ